MLHFLILLLLVPSALSEFTVILPDSTSPLIDSPQTGFSSHARTDPAEQQAVYQVMAATGNTWAGSIPDVCRGRWHGIECTPDTNDVYHVVSLSFGALSDDTAFPTCDTRAATLHPAILKLTHLRALFFYRCFVYNPQPVPPFLGKLGPALRSLVLRDNGHVGPIPAELGDLTSLKLLDLHGNHLTSSVPGSLSKLTRIRKLDLSNNRLTGGLPDLRSPDLNVLDLSRNFLQGRIRPSLARSVSLIKLDLSRNRLTGPIPDSLNSLENLMLLDLSHNSLSGPLPASLQGLSSLRALILKSNPMGPTRIPSNGLSGLKELSTLVLSNMGLNGPIPECIAELASLRVLHLDGNALNSSIPAGIGKLDKLSELRLENNLLTGMIPLGKEMIWKMGRNLKVDNNTGLCYDVADGVLKGVDSLSTISYCDPETTTPAAARTTQHLSLLIRGGSSQPPSSSSSSSSPSRCIIDHSWFGRVVAWFMICALLLL
ncbi:protein TOO MANY MOUTHS-like [Iris pallida]|uniref:Protein TOO MANY MOUTHS-like n=1 Tax=Iris pallida TaxID=29817 RepID=A0AAX6IDD4_IRIPA|nr:protein TOO MANY MOUTHS-like [Iris pallida]